jgi:hypothetical protein
MKYQIEADLTRYWPSEVRAIQEHKYFLGMERGYDPPMEEVLESWERQYAKAWRTAKMRRDVEAQLREIEACRARLASDTGRTIGFAEAARTWVDISEREWRDRWESGA